MGRVRQRAIAVVLAMVGALAFASAAQAAQVTISGFTVNGASATKAAVGDTIVVSGTNFLAGASASSNVVKVNGIAIATFTDVEFWIVVEDTVNGQAQTYHSDAGNSTLIYDPGYFVYP